MVFLVIEQKLPCMQRYTFWTFFGHVLQDSGSMSEAETRSCFILTAGNLVPRCTTFQNHWRLRPLTIGLKATIWRPPIPPAEQSERSVDGRSGKSLQTRTLRMLVPLHCRTSKSIKTPATEVFRLRTGALSGLATRGELHGFRGGPHCPVAYSKPWSVNPVSILIRVNPVWVLDDVNNWFGANQAKKGRMNLNEQFGCLGSTCIQSAEFLLSL